MEMKYGEYVPVGEPMIKCPICHRSAYYTEYDVNEMMSKALGKTTYTCQFSTGEQPFRGPVSHYFYKP